MLLIYLDENALSETEREHCYAESAQVAQELYADGQYLATAPLHPTSTATSVRVRDGRRLVTDGPFAETREQLGGYFLIEAQDLDEAIGIAGRIPGARISVWPMRSQPFPAGSLRPSRSIGRLSGCNRMTRKPTTIW